MRTELTVERIRRQTEDFSRSCPKFMRNMYKEIEFLSQAGKFNLLK